jgi:hypothetical protein
MHFDFNLVLSHIRESTTGGMINKPSWFAPSSPFSLMF